MALVPHALLAVTEIVPLINVVAKFMVILFKPEPATIVAPVGTDQL